MGRLTDIAGGEQLALDDVLAEFRAEAPPEGADPDVIISSVANIGDVSQVKKGTGPHDGDCPYTQQCEQERRRRSYYLPGRCHWIAWGDVGRCPKLNGGVT